MMATLSEVRDSAPYGAPATHGAGKDLAIITYGNGAYMSRRCAELLKSENIDARIIDLRWLAPLPMEGVLRAIDGASAILIVDECRQSGSLAEEVMTKLHEAGIRTPISRLNGRDTYIPLGPAADTVLISEQDILEAARALCTDSGRK